MNTIAQFRIFAAGRTLLMLLLCASLLLPLNVPTIHAQSEKDWLYQQINALRNSLGLQGYALNSALSAAAQVHSEWMAATGIIAHDQDDGSGPPERAIAAGYIGGGVSENIYGGTTATAQTAWTWWLNSTIHYAGITNPDKNEVGIGIASADGVTYYTLVFGRGSGVTAPAPVQQQAAPPPAEVDQPPVEAQVASVEGQAVQVDQPPAPVQEQPQPTRPLITFTPSPTIPTLTPTITWTPTFTWTPSPTATIPPPSSTPIVFPTAVPLTAQPSSTPIESPTPLVVALAPLEAAPSPVLVASADQEQEEDGFNWRLPLLILIGVQVVGIGWVFWRLAKK